MSFMEISTQLPDADVQQILALVRARTDAPIRWFRDTERDPEVMTGKVFGHTWVFRRAPSGWKILQALPWLM